MPEKLTLTEKEFCDRVGICRLTAMRMRQSGKLPYCRIGNKILYLPRHVEEFFANCERRPRDARRKLR
jgi:predicted site-specific integrase-resolvase